MTTKNEKVINQSNLLHPDTQKIVQAPTLGYRFRFCGLIDKIVHQLRVMHRSVYEDVKRGKFGDDFDYLEYIKQANEEFIATMEKGMPFMHYIAYFNDIPVGAILSKFKLSEKTIEVEDLCLLTAYRGIGIEEKMIDHLISMAKDGKFEKILISKEIVTEPYNWSHYLSESFKEDNGYTWTM